MKFISGLLIIVGIPFFAQEPYNPVGNYLLETQISKAKSLTMHLKIKKKSYQLDARNPFKGDYTEYGTWEVKDNVLILSGETRKFKQDKNSNYHGTFDKEEIEYTKVEKYNILEGQLCSIHSTNQGKGYCFMKE